MRVLGGVIVLLLLTGQVEAGKRQRAAGVALVLIGSALTFGGTGLLAGGIISGCPTTDFGCPSQYNALVGSGLTMLSLGQLSIIAGSAMWGASGRRVPIDTEPVARRRSAMFLSGLVLTGVGLGSIALGAGLLASNNAGFLNLGAAAPLGLGAILVVTGIPLAVVGRPRKSVPRVAFAPVRGGALATLGFSY